MHASNDAMPEELRDPAKCLERGRIVEMRMELFSLCEAIEDEATEKLKGADTEHAKGFYRGKRMAAKSIRDAMGEVMRTTLGKSEGMQ
jgi:hypothetical protein